MSNVAYYQRRAAGLCPECGGDPTEGRVFCADCRAFHQMRAAVRRETDRPNYNLYMRDYQRQRKSSQASHDV